MRAFLRRVGPLLKPIRGRLVLGMISAIAATVAALMIPQLLAGLVNTSLGHDGTIATVLWAGGLVLLLGVFEALMMYLRRVLTVAPSTGVELGLRVRFHRYLLQLPVSVHARFGSGQLLSRSMGDIGVMRRWIGFALIMIFSDIATITIGIAMMARDSPLLALVFGVVAAPILLLSWQFSQRFGRISRSTQDQVGDLATNVEESVYGIRVLKAFGRSEHALDGFTQRAEQLRETEVRRATTLGRYEMFLNALPSLGLGLALAIGLLQVGAGTLTVGGLTAFFATAVIVRIPVIMIGQLLGQTATAAAALDRVEEVMQTPVTIRDPEVPHPLPADAGALRCEGVGFHFPDAPERPLFRGLDLEVRPGETMALVGVTGSGKSTLLELVLRLHEVSEGAITLGGVDVRDLTLQSLRSAVSVAFEDATLFSSSVRENVLLGVDGLSDAEREARLVSALRVADAEFVFDLPDGVETNIGEQGLSLSGGQRQRISLARAVATAPSVLLLDDPLSAVDTRTEERVTARLREALAGTTTLIVAHRSSTVALADRVALIAEGQVKAVGTHAELLASSPDYAQVMSSAERADGDDEGFDTLMSSWRGEEQA